ncbi:MAG: SGNH/GDSL hydrolase family protein [bacterium]
MWKNILLLLATIIVCLLIIELAFRLVSPGEPPGTTYGKIVQLNSDGLRDVEFAIPKPEGRYRILFLGDSFTWGIGLDLSETLPKQCLRELQKEFDNVEVVNASTPAYNTVDELLLLEQKGLKYQPDLVVLVYCLNDIQYKPHLVTVPYDSSKVVPIFQVEKRDGRIATDIGTGLRAFIFKCQMKSQFLAFLVPRVGAFLKKLGVIHDPRYSWEKMALQGYVDQNPGWLEAKRALSEIADLCQEHRIKLIAAIYPFLINFETYGSQPVHESISEYMHSLGIPNVDLLTAFEPYKSGRKFWINYLNAHPNAEAQNIAAQALLPLIIQQMRTEPPQVSNSKSEPASPP